MTFTFKLYDLDNVMANKHAKTDQRSFRFKVIVQTYAQTHTAGRLLYLAIKSSAKTVRHAGYISVCDPAEI